MNLLKSLWNRWPGWGKPIRAGAVAVAMTGMAAGCTQQDQTYMREGIGPNLAISGKEIDQNTTLQDQYFRYLCQQTGLSNEAVYDENGLCSDFGPDATKWTLIVYQGMNDIDRRCDNYLEWLARAKRSKDRDVLLVKNNGERTGSILSAIWPGPNSRGVSLAINLTAHAFGLLSTNIENYYSRLIMVAEDSTVTSVVFRERDRFRKDLLKENLTFLSRPDAEHALRQYLRICLPMTIEAQINDIATLGSRNIALNEENSLLQTPGSVPSVGTQPFRASSAIVKVERGEDGAGHGNIITKSKIETAIQDALCVQADGELGPRTVEAIKIYQQVTGQPDNGALELKAKREIINNIKGKCVVGIKNYFEREQFSNNPRDKMALNDLKSNLLSLANSKNILVNIEEPSNLDELRKHIEIIKRGIGGDLFKEGRNSYLNQEYTPDLGILF